MNALRAPALALLVLGTAASLATHAETPGTSGGYIDGAMFRALVDDTKDVVEVNLDGAILQGPASEALALVQKTDKKLVAAGWQRITRITDSTSTISVLTHTVGDRVDGLVALIFSSDDKELVFANLAGEIDVSQLGEIGKRLNVPGLDQVPGAR
jgi:hypothetical protein